MITALCGPNTYKLNQENKKLIAEFIEKYGAIAIEQFEADEVEEAKVISALESSPFLTGRKLIVVKNLSANKVLCEKLEELIQKTNDSTDLIIVEPNSDKRTKYYKELKKLTEFKEFSELDKYELSRWAVEFAKSNGGIITAGDATYLIERIGLNQYKLANELLKLVNYQPKIDKHSIDILTIQTPQSTIFNLLDAALSGDTKKALKIYDEQRQQKEEPQKILGMIAWQLHILALSKTINTKTSEKIAVDSGINPYVLQKTAAIAKSIDLSQVKNMIKKAAKLDIDSKSRNIDADDAIKNYLLELPVN